MIKVLQSHPEYASQIASYISRYKKIPVGLADDIKTYLDNQEIYHSVLSVLLDACLERLPPPFDNDIGQAAAGRLLTPKAGALPLQPTYKASLIAWALSARKLTFAEYEGIVSGELDWWVKKRSVIGLSSDIYGEPSYEAFLNARMRENDSEMARICAARLVEGSHKLAAKYGTVETTAKHVLKAAKLIRVVGAPDSRIPEIVAYIFERKITVFDWKTLFGSGHKDAERMMIMIKRDREANIEKFLVHLDSWCDLLLSELYPRLKPGKTYPKNYGVALNDPNLAAALPDAIPALKGLHALRLESSVSHPRNRKTGKATRRLKHHDFYKLRKQLALAFDEIEKVIVP